MEAHDHGTMTQAEFAAAQQLTQARVSQLKAEGRLVMTDDGKRVRVAESLARIQATATPAHAGRAARRAAQKAAQAAGEGQGNAAAPEAPQRTAGNAQGAPSYILETDYQGRRARALALQEEATARKAARDEEIELGTLLHAEDVRTVVADAAARFRSALENLGPTIAPMLAATSDESRIVVMLAEAHEQVLAELARQFHQIGAQPQ